MFHLTILVLTKASWSTDSYSDTLKELMTDFTLLNKGLKSKSLNCIMLLYHFNLCRYSNSMNVDSVCQRFMLSFLCEAAVGYVSGKSRYNPNRFGNGPKAINQIKCDLNLSH